MMNKPVAIVTGASRGIGECIAGTLDDMGYTCALVARTERDLRKVKERLGPHHHVCPADLNCLDTLSDVVKRVLSQAGRLDVLVNNAGLSETGPILGGDLEEWHRTIHVNTLALMHLTREAAPHIIKSDRGAVINVVSMAGQQVRAGMSAYCASKHAARAFSLATFEELREHGVKVCALCPGLVNTGGLEEEGIRRDAMLQPSDIAYAVRFVLEFPRTGCPTEITLRPQKNPRG